MTVKSRKARVGLITGGSSGIGLATALRFASAGYRLAICGRDESRLEDAANKIEQAGCPECFARVSDLADPDHAIQFAEESISHFGAINVLINNAANAPLSPFETMDVEDFENTINVNIRTVFHLTQTVWRQMLKQSQGIIVNVSSMSAVDPFPGFSVYGATKAWIDLMTVGLANEGKERGIRVYSVRPGAVDTPMLRGLFPDFPEDAAVQPDDVAAVIWSLCQKEMKYSSGEFISVKK